MTGKTKITPGNLLPAAIQLITLLFLTACASTSVVSEQAIAGDWETVKGDYESISLEITEEGRVFSAYLDGRLINHGTWSLENGVLAITLENGHGVVYEKVALGDGRLSLIAGKENELYRRPRSNVEKVRDLLTDLAHTLAFGFSEPVPAEFNWNVNMEDKPLVIKGQRISLAVSIEDDYSQLNNKAATVGRALEEMEFFISDLNVTENTTGYESGFYRIIIRTRANGSGENGNAFVDVLCGVAED